MATSEQLTMLRAMVDGDFERHQQLSNALHASGGLDDYGEVIGAAFYIAVRKQFPERYSTEDVIRLVANTRTMVDQTGDVIDPHAAELVVRAALGEHDRVANLSDRVVVESQMAVCSYLSAEGLLGEPEVFMGEVQELLNEWAADDEAAPNPA
jgi:hypothetical protein